MLPSRFTRCTDGITWLRPVRRSGTAGPPLHSTPVRIQQPQELDIMSSTTDSSQTTSATPAPSARSPRARSSFAEGLTLFAGVVLITVGVFQFLQGLAAILKGDFYVVAPENIFEFNVSGWGWVHVILGIGLAVTGYFILLGKTWARVV